MRFNVDCDAGLHLVELSHHPVGLEAGGGH